MALVLSDISSAFEKATAMPFMLQSDAVDYYHSLTSTVQSDWNELTKVLAQRFDSISIEPVYLSRMLTLKECDFPRHADYVREF